MEFAYSTTVVTSYIIQGRGIERGTSREFSTLQIGPECDGI